MIDGSAMPTTARSYRAIAENFVAIAIPAVIGMVAVLLIAICVPIERSPPNAGAKQIPNRSSLEAPQVLHALGRASPAKPIGL